MKTNIIVTLQVEGVHHWPNAKNVFPEVGFLSRSHRHIFNITSKKQISLTSPIIKAYGNTIGFNS